MAVSGPSVKGCSNLTSGGQWTANRVPTWTGDGSVVWTILGWLLM
jgi:hypothetical protein